MSCDDEEASSNHFYYGSVLKHCLPGFEGFRPAILVV